ncbi:hypothetical protein SEPCBS119000_005228 [Sporothrix epigloea]|uniref:Endo-1,3(4)-beta-glucanase 1 carbohydrate binding domain-containing protein n=1 Tax=Sporothrix epigloea TaxID=1892477 RepID=A0ABP0DWR4_9PEZI
MTRSISLALSGLLAAAGLAQATNFTCGDTQYDSSVYVCYDNKFACPIIAGEGLSYCSGACYSRFMYTCTDNAVKPLKPLAAGTPFSLYVSNPAVMSLDGMTVGACGQQWNAGNKTCSYCPKGASCPSSPSTVMLAPSGSGPVAMDASAPGGQSVYIDSTGAVGYTQAHSASAPANSTSSGLVVYEHGGLVDLNSAGYGWAACPSQVDGAYGYTIYSVNKENGEKLSKCTPVNLRAKALPSGTVGAWQYS